MIDETVFFEFLMMMSESLAHGASLPTSELGLRRVAWSEFQACSGLGRSFEALAILRVTGISGERRQIVAWYKYTFTPPPWLTRPGGALWAF
jgi:hypothetical protein